MEQSTVALHFPHHPVTLTPQTKSCVSHHRRANEGAECTKSVIPIPAVAAVASSNCCLSVSTVPSSAVTLALSTLVCASRACTGISTRGSSGCRFQYVALINVCRRNAHPQESARRASELFHRQKVVDRAFNTLQSMIFEPPSTSKVACSGPNMTRKDRNKAPVAYVLLLAKSRVEFGILLL